MTNMNLTSRPDFRQYAKGRAVHIYFAGYKLAYHAQFTED